MNVDLVTFIYWCSDSNVHRYTASPKICWVECLAQAHLDRQTTDPTAFVDLNCDSWDQKNTTLAFLLSD